MKNHQEPIAIIGMGCRLPGGASSPQKLWELLCQGFDGIIDVPKERWDIRRFYDADPAQPGKMAVARGGFLQERLDEFDASFFYLSPREAAWVDPQQRLLLETSWEAFEDAGLIPAKLKGSQTGMFIGGFTTDWQSLHHSPDNVMLADLYTGINSSQTVLSARLSYFYDLKGPCLTTDTACSSSLVAVHLACQSLWQGECTLALAGGVNAMLTPSTTIAMSKGRFLNPAGQCRSFDAAAKGYVRGEGAGVVVLKPLSLALQDGDEIYALIRASGINHDGHTSGLALPNPAAQKALIEAVVNKAKVDPADIQYVEAHGTGTPAGDPAEAWALDQVLHSSQPGRKKCLLGSIKSNIGHLEAAAGVAGLIKAVLCLKHRLVAPNLHFSKPNPAIPFESYCLAVPVGVQKFPEPEKTLFAGVNSFGYGGTNAHIVLQEHITAKRTDSCSLARPFAFPFSAYSHEALKASLYNVATYLQGNPDVPAADIAHTLGRHRERHGISMCVLAKTTEELQQRLWEAHAQEDSAYAIKSDGIVVPPKMAFVYTGMGPQWWGMGRELIENEAVFKQTMELCDRFLLPLSGWSLLAELSKDEDVSNMSLPQYAQPANFAIQAALTALLTSWGVMPAAVVGHSIGEVGAAYAAGSITLEEGVLISFHRSQIQSRRQGLGTMLAAELTEPEALEIVKAYPQQVFIGAINSPSTVTFSGAEASLSQIAAKLDAEGVFQRFLNVNIAYHSGQMDGLESEVLEVLAPICPKASVRPFFSTVTGTEYAEEMPDAAYWWQNIRQPVLFQKALQAMISQGYNLFVEIGPHPVLGKSIKDIIKASQSRGLSLYTLNKKEAEQPSMAFLLGRLHMAGVELDWQRLLPAGAKRLPLPAYPWQRKTYWTESEQSRQYLHSLDEHVMLARKCQSPGQAFTVEVNRGFFPWLDDHKLDGSVVFPAAAYVEAGLALHRQRHGSAACILENLSFSQALVVMPGVEPLLRISSVDATSTFEVHALSNQLDGSWTQHASGKMHPAWKGYVAAHMPVEELKAGCHEEVAAEKIYQHFNKHGMQYGPAFQLIRRLYKGKGEAMAQIAVPPEHGHYILPPPVLDAALQTLLGTKSSLNGKDGLALPVHIDELHFFAAPKGNIWCYAKERVSTEDSFTGDIQLCDDAGMVFAEVRGVTCRLFKARQHDLKANLDKLLYQATWEQITNFQLPSVPSLAGQEWQLVCTDQTKHAQLHALLTECGAHCVDKLSAGQPGNVLLLCPAQADEGVDYSLSVRLLELAKELASQRHGHACNLWIVTQGVQGVVPEDVPTSIQASALWGLAAVLRRELPQLNCRLLDLDGGKPFSGKDLLQVLSARQTECEMALRQGKLYGPRFKPGWDSGAQAAEEMLPLNADNDAFELELSQPGSIENLRFRQSMRHAPAAGEVEMRVHTASLNFKDLMKVMGLLDKSVLEGTYFGNSFGMECSGTVIAVGKGVRTCKVGDQVCAFARNTFSSFLTLPAEAVCAAPANTSMEEAPVYIPFITVIRGLKDMANLKKGETVLIHTATGAVGLAAVQYARQVGANIIATAGSEEKRAYLHALGIAQVADSRSLQFASQVLAWTNGRGVDVILNALSGEALLKSWRLLAPYGRFIEIGKRDISQNSGLPMEVFQRNTTFAAIDLDRTFAEDKKIIRRLLRETLTYFEKGIFKPLPCQVFPPAQVHEAFHLLARARHIGKVMVKFDHEKISALPMLKHEGIFHGHATYLVTGGLHGFGLATARWIVANGGKHLILLSRQGAATEKAKAAVVEFARQGIGIKTAAVDVGNIDQLSAALKSLLPGCPPLKGVFHGAMVLDDGLIGQLDAGRFTAVMHPKVAGCWNLHQLTKDMDLDYFVLYSSISALIGNPGQGNYAAANAFLDAFAGYRRARGLPAHAVNFGAIADVGVLAGQAALAFHLQHSGITPIAAEQALQVLGQVLTSASGQYGIMQVDWPKLFSTLPSLRQEARFASLQTAQAEGGHSDFAQRLLGMDIESQLATLIDFIGSKVAHTLKMDVHKVDTDVKLNTLGMDSLMAMELQHLMENKLSCKIPTMELMKGPSIKELSRSIQKLLHVLKA